MSRKRTGTHTEVPAAAGNEGPPFLRLLGSERLDASTGARVLRTLYAGMFLAQSVLALAVAALVLALSGGGQSGVAVLGQVLIALAGVQLLLGAFLPGALAREPSRASVLSATLLAAVLLSATSWFLAFAAATGQSALVLTVLGAATSSGYALGFVQVGRFARRLVASPSLSSEV